MKRTSTWLILGVAIVSLGLLSFQGKVFKSLEVEELKIRTPNGQGYMVLGFKENLPSIRFFNEQGQAVMDVLGGNMPSFNILDSKYSDRSRVQLVGGERPGMFIRNPENKTIASLTTLSDNGGGFGLADKNGVAASIIRGGANPSISFFNPKSEPMAAMGMIQNVPHLLISGPLGNEGVLIHGGKPASFVVVDELGKVKILISKQGVFQGKNQSETPSNKKKDQRVFSLEDQEMLFPEGSTPEGSNKKTF